MANTTNLNLAKPAGTDKALVSVLNSNSDKIDAWAGTTNQALSTLSGNKVQYLGSITTGSEIADCLDNALSAMTLNNAMGYFAYGGYWYNVVIMKNNNNWASAFLNSYRGIEYTYSCIKSNGAWSIEQLALKSDGIAYMDITDTTPININSKTNQTVGISNFIGCTSLTSGVMLLPYNNSSVQYLKAVNYSDMSSYSGSVNVRVWYKKKL
jgi:hypothetical protein